MGKAQRLAEARPRIRGLCEEPSRFDVARLFECRLEIGVAEVAIPECDDDRT